MTDADITGALRVHWGLQTIDLQPLSGGMNSSTWKVRTDADDRLEQCWVAKLVRTDQHDTFVRGLHAAALVQACDIRAGAPLLTGDGADHIDLPGGSLALLGWVDGDPLVGAQEWEQTLIGTTLAAAHQVLRGVVDASAQDFPRWVDPDADHLDVEQWVRPAVRSALGAYQALDHHGLAYGLLHADPEPGAFLYASGQVGALIDWSSAEHGPLLYDLASALMYVGGPQQGRALLEAYASTAGIPAAGLTEDVHVLLALRQAVQADYFARRLATGDLTGITDAEDNWHGLRAAERYFTEST